jgi:tetratricopeptide (TPR) repeat protein
MGSVLATAFTDTSGEARLRVSGSGYFRLRVTGPEIEESFSDGFAIDRGGMSQNISVRVKLKADANGGSAAPGGMVSAANLNIPGRARKENEKGMEEAKDSHWPKAIEHFRKAIEAYPKYDTAYNNLGVVYFSSGDTAHAREAFAKAAELNPQNVKAGRNLARIVLNEKNYTEAKILLERTLTVEPTSADSLNLLAALYFQTGDYKQALVNARKVHTVPHEGFAISHLIAARSLEHLNEPQDAAAELKIFLKESPESPNAEQVRKALSRLEAANRQAQ